jgi:hypothetical protein
VKTPQPYKDRSVWVVRDMCRIVVDHYCSAGDTRYGFWPGDPECTGFLNAVKIEPVPEDPLLASMIRDRPVKTSGDVSVGGQWGEASQLYLMLARLKDPVVTIEGTSYRLNDFADRIEQDHAKRLAAVARQVEEDRSEVIKTGIGLTIALVFAIAVLRCAGPIGPHGESNPGSALVPKHWPAWERTKPALHWTKSAICIPAT